MLKHPRMKALVVGVVMGLTGAQFAFAQSTTASNVTGRVIDAEGRPVAGAVVEITHVPSGTKRTVTTDAEGRYTSRGLRVGGPFTVTVTKEGFETETLEDLSFQLGITQTLNVTIIPEAAELAAVEVTGARINTVFDPANQGLSTSVMREQIDALPSIARSIEDYVRIDPRVTQYDKERGGVSAGGQNNRYNNITIDGVPTNDEFGLNDGGLPTTEGSQPISIDTIEEISIGISSYDVAQSDFTGANINAVTRSGTNEFRGSVYTYYRNNDWVGDDQFNQPFRGFEDQLTVGGTFGGPIIQDRLFFFVSYERFKSDNPAPDVNFRIRNGVRQQIVADSDIQRILAAAQRYGFSPGGLTIDGITNEDNKYLIKLDWNASESQRLSVRWNRTEQETLRTPNIGVNSISFSNYWYTQQFKFNSFVGHLYSDWSTNFSSEFSLSYSSYDSVPINRTLAPSVRVGVNNNADSVFFGTEQFRHANELLTDTITGYFAGNYFLGDHEIKFGVDFKRNDIFNLFLESFYGRYEATSVENFEAGRLSRYTLRFPAQGTDPGFAAADWALRNWGLFIQDTWNASPNLTINYGLRWDLPQTSDRPPLNSAFQTAFGLPNDGTVDGNGILQPRVGFNYTFNTERQMQLRGGVGLFAGSSPGVWLSNPFTNNGLTIRVLDVNNPTGIPITATLPTSVPNITGTPIRADVDLVDPNFEQPAVWKGTLAFDYELPWYGLVASAELLFTEAKNSIFYEHLNLGPGRGQLPDGRTFFWSSVAETGFTNPASPTAGRRNGNNPAFNDVLLLRTTNKGNARNATLSLEKPMENNWFAKLAYTYGEAEDPNPGTSSRAISNWNSRIIFNPNEEVSARSNYAIKDRFTAAFTYQHYFFEGLATRFSAFWEARSGRPFSYVFLGDANGDNISGNDLFYVPSGPGDVFFRTPEQETAFFRWLETNQYLNSRRGQVVERNASNMPWARSIDLRISQELPAFFDVKGTVFLDILNFGNLLDEDWGVIDEVGFPFGVPVARFAGVRNGRYVYDYTFGEAGPTLFQRRDARGQSRWQAQLGIRLAF